MRPNIIIPLLCLGLIACNATTQKRIQQSAPKCSYIFGDRELKNCTLLADSGDADAALTVAEYYNRGGLFGGTNHNPQLSMHYYRTAADKNSRKAIRFLFDAYRIGAKVPKNEEQAEVYFKKALDTQAEWAELVHAKKMESFDSKNSLALYIKLARVNNNCFAQQRLAEAYVNGDLAEKNYTKAYFWALIGGVGGFTRKSETHSLFGHQRSCFTGNFATQYKLEKTLPREFLRAAQNAALNWQSPMPEPVLAAAPVKIDPPRKSEGKDSPYPAFKWPTPKSHTKNKPSRENVISSIEPNNNLPKWAALPRSARGQAVRGSRSAQELFLRLSRSIWVVIAASDPTSNSAASQGSAVAVTSNLLFTNCHVVKSHKKIAIRQLDLLYPVTIFSADVEGDRCLLRSSVPLPIIVPGVRTYDDVQIGEQVFSIGSPAGLESTLGSGIVSGLRTLRKQKLIQTTAQVSRGSSGGGLFDASGNLLGITTFMLRDTQGLNFAISADEYFAP